MVDTLDARPATSQPVENRPFNVERRPDGSIRIRTPKSNWVVREGGDGSYKGRVIYTLDRPNQPGQREYYGFSIYKHGDIRGVGVYEPIKRLLTPEQEKHFLEGIWRDASEFSMRYKTINLETVETGKPGCNEGVDWNYTVNEVIGRTGLYETEDFKGTGYEDFRKILYKLRASRSFGA